MMNKRDELMTIMRKTSTDYFSEWNIVTSGIVQSLNTKKKKRNI